MQIITTDAKHTLMYYRIKINPLVNIINSLIYVESDLKVVCEAFPLKEIREQNAVKRISENTLTVGYTSRSLSMI